MRGQLKAGFLVIAAALVSGCASMSPEECANSDWRAIGYEDGARGYSSNNFGGRRKACAKHGYTADFDAYQDGRREGLVEYCQPSRGFQVGASGGRYYGVCDAALEGGFLEAYRIGSQLYSLRSAVNAADSAIHGREAELERTKQNMLDREAALIAKDTPTEERIIILAELKDLAERTGEIETELDNLVADRAAAQVELRNYEQQIAEYGY